MKGIIMGNKDNVILNSKDEQVGYYEDLRACLEWSVAEFVKSKDYEQAREMCDLLTDLETYSDYEEILVLSENNGMGYTIRKYVDTISQEK